MSATDRGTSLREIKKIMGRTRRRIEEEKKDQRYNDIQTRHIVSQIAKNISPEGLNTMRPSVRSNSQTHGIPKGQTGPTSGIFRAIEEHLSQKRENIDSKEHHDQVYQDERSKYLQKKEARRNKTLTQSKVSVPKRECKSRGCVISGGKKRRSRTSKRKKSNRKHATKKRIKRNKSRNNKMSRRKH